MRTSSYCFEFRSYQRQFSSPLKTSHGSWEVREGVIVRLVDHEGKASYGEIAPISWFGSETVHQAQEFCNQLPQMLTKEMIVSIPDALPACQFGFESALDLLGEANCDCNDAQFSGLLPAGKAALSVWQRLWEQGYRTFKWKIGVDAIADELEIFETLIRSLPAAAMLRLDANGGLNGQQAHLWLQMCDRLQDQVPVKIEFIEQPLAVEEFAAMLKLSRMYKTVIALDESVATLAQLQQCYHKGWRGVFVVKPAIAGFPSRLRRFCHQYPIDPVFSSAFETEIGKTAALRLAAELSSPHRALGFGVSHLFAEDSQWLEQLWNTR